MMGSISLPVFPSIRPSPSHPHRNRSYTPNAETRCLTSTSPSRPAPHQNRLPTLSRLLTQSVENTSLLLQTAPLTNATASKPTAAPTPNTNHDTTPFFLSPHPHRSVSQKPTAFAVRANSTGSILRHHSFPHRTLLPRQSTVVLIQYSIRRTILSSLSASAPLAPRNNPPRRLAETRSDRGTSYTIS